MERILNVCGGLGLSEKAQGTRDKAQERFKAEEPKAKKDQRV